MTTTQDKGTIFRIAGPVVVAKEIKPRMYDVCRVGNESLMGEVIQIEGDKVIIQVYEDTSGIRPGEPVVNTGEPLKVELGPGMLGSIYDGIQRPLPVLIKQMGDFIKRGVDAPGLDQHKKWDFKAIAKKGDEVSGGSIIGEVEENPGIIHKILIPPNQKGKISEIKSGKFTVNEVIGSLDNGYELRLKHNWPVRIARPVSEKLKPEAPLITGQRIFDALFPLAKGGVAAIPGPFGAGKCVSGDTLIFVNDNLIRIEDLYNECSNNKNNEVVESNKSERLVKLKIPLRIKTFNGKKIADGIATHVYKGKTNLLIKIKTGSGREAILTPIHKLFKISPHGIEETEAWKLNVGDFILSPTMKEYSVNEVNEGYLEVDSSIEINGHIHILKSKIESVFQDVIIKTELIKKECYVYDITVPNTHNFIGGNFPMILHNTVSQQQLAKWSDADIIVYVGCGERGNEMTEVLTEFPELTDPRSGKPLMNRTVLIANTSNMPVAAREASIYTGVTIAEYYRDMGYSVALMADSTSRWAEAMREISSRLEEMPGEEGYPAYLSTKLAQFYERSGRVVPLGTKKEGSISIIGAVSPPGGDISEPVSQSTLRVAKVFWKLDAKLAQRRHFPSINWLDSYSNYISILEPWYSKNVSPEWKSLVAEMMSILQEEDKLLEIVQLVGSDALPDRQQLVLQVARLIREVLLQQNAFHEIDTYCDLKKTYLIMKSINRFSKLVNVALDNGMRLQQILDMKAKDRLGEVKFVKDYEKLLGEITAQMEKELKA